MTTASASAAEPRHTRGGAGRAGRVRPRRPQQRALQTIDIPERIYRGSHYSDAFIKAWVKMAALDVDTNPEHCNAHVAEMARFCGLSKRDFERALTEGSTPGPDAGDPEFSTRRMTRKSGVGRTAIRQVRPVREDEHFVTVSVAMCDALEPRRLRAAILLAHADRYQPGYQPTASELAGELFHHHGESAGQPISDRTARRIMHDLDATGWVSLGRRAGYQGRHTVTVNRHPILVEQLALDIETATPASGPAAPVDKCPPAAVVDESSADNHGGSGPATSGGSLAIKEYNPTLTDDATQVVGGSRRRRGTGSRPVDNSGDLAGGTFGPDASRAPRGTHTPSPATTYTGPDLAWTDRIRQALTPISGSDLDGIRRYLLRRIAREIGRQLDSDPHTSSQRIAARITRRLQPLLRDDIRDLGAWLLSVGLPHRGCGQPWCEDGEVWPTGAPCETCADARQVQRAQWRRAREWQAALDAQRARTTAAAELPAKATFRERAAATDAEVLAAVAEHGPVGALHRYGQLRVGPLLRTADIQEQLPAPAVSDPLAEPPARHVPGRMPDALRTAARRTPGHDLAASCPDCQAAAGHACTTRRGRTRAPHDARLDAHPAAPDLAAASGEDTV
ncbi:zinc finger domain-containing protein [Streptomyces fructofermentans]|uniref:DNA-binding phage zinc finger domain-containing protein n=1 Tax=Streptomyces fructofermentans TaxID=152141 RepID=A0A918U6Q3_9ACTN|nr:hypothetical protein [Streptomyces fructofermentans]GGX99064.1 hypothetical protein GCM10010515_76530 [Streptomyces fructofermentans]